MKKFRAEGELPGDVGLKIRRSVNRTAGGEEQVLVVTEMLIIHRFRVIGDKRRASLNSER